MSDCTAQADLCIVGGAGHVGLPLAIVFANTGMRVQILDLNEEVMNTVKSGTVPFMEEGAEPLLKEALANDRLLFSRDPKSLSSVPTVIVTIGTPLDEFLNPETRVIKDWVDECLEYLSDDQLIVLRSTVFPGTTDWLGEYLVKRGTNLRLAYCPERIVQGFAVKELQELPQIISGVTPEAEKSAAELFERIAPEVVRLSPLEAEFAKLFCNAYRYIQFAAANQFYMIAASAGADYSRILAGMKKDYPRMAGVPGAGFAAGPCLFKDTMQLAAFSQNQFALGQAAMLVNEGLILYMVKKIDEKHALHDLTVGLLGMAFKAGSDDTRSSLSYKLKKQLEFRAKGVLCTDPYVTTDPTLVPVEEVVEKSDLLVLCVPHSDYTNFDAGGKTVVDIWDMLGSGSLI